MQHKATGTFEVTMAPAGESDEAAGVTLARFDLSKVFSGDVEGTSTGDMLTARTGVPTSAGYVAIERFAGTVNDREGQFVLQHSGIMQGETQSLTITIVPDSGTGALSGIEGQLLINIEDGVHHYTLEYALPDAASD